MGGIERDLELRFSIPLIPPIPLILVEQLLLMMLELHRRFVHVHFCLGIK